MICIKEIDEIVNGSFKVTKKQKMLLQLKKEVDEEIDVALEIAKEGYQWCPKCKEYYKEKAWECIIKREKKNIYAYCDAGYGDDDICEEKTCSILYDICPMGHVIEVGKC